MDCSSLSRYVDLFLDGELASQERAEVEQHLRTCEPCRDAVNRESRFRASLRQAMQAMRAPGSLHEQVAARIREGGAPRLPRWAPTLAYAAGVAVIAALGYLLVGTTLSTEGPELRALAIHQESQNTEVLGDRGRVESFLKARAPFAYRLPVEERDGVRLVGARLARLDGVPAVVYLYDASGRRFSVAQYPAPEGWHPGPAHVGHRDGFTYATYGDSGLVQTVVGDLPEPEMSRIVPAAWGR